MPLYETAPDGAIYKALQVFGGMLERGYCGMEFIDNALVFALFHVEHLGIKKEPFGSFGCVQHFRKTRTISHFAAKNLPECSLWITPPFSVDNFVDNSQEAF